MRKVTTSIKSSLRTLGAAVLLAALLVISPLRTGLVSQATAATIGTGACATTVSSTTGVTASTLNSSCILKFTATSTFTWTSPPSVTSLRILVVGGGGGAGSRHSGGGGAGGFLSSDTYTITPLTNYSITVGAGGAGLSDGSAACGAAGSASSFGTVVANGGGAGCNPNQSTAGGSSGGTGNNSYTIGAATPGTVGGVTVTNGSTVSGVTGYGNIGGSGFQQTCESAINTTAWCGGGGGGAGGAGGNASTSGAGGGGAGRQSSIVSPALMLAAGGGGAGGRSNAPCPSYGVAGAAGGAGGSNIGGNGGGYTLDGIIDATDGAANTGSGGGGGAFCDGTNYPGGSGGSGIVIVRWIPDTTAPSVSSWTPPSTPTKDRTLSFGLAFDESVTGLVNTDFSNAGTATCSFSPNTSSGTTFTVTATCTTDGTVIPTLASNSVTDLNANNGPASSSASTSVTIDTAAPTVTWGATPLLTSSLVMQFSLTTSKTISGLTASDFSTSGTASSCSVSVSSSSGTNFTVDATCTSPGTVKLQLASLSVTDSPGNTGPVAASDSPEATIPKLTQATLTVTSTTATYGQTLSLTATGGSGNGAISWQKTSGTCSVSGTSLTPGDAGSICEVRATRAGDDSYEPKDSAVTAITINKASQSTLSVATSSVPYGRTTTLTSTGGSGNGAVTFAVVSGTCSITSGTTLTPGTVGSSCVVQATKATDTNFSQAVSTNATITIVKGSQSGFSISSAATFETGSSHSLTATGGQGTGSVTWSVTSGSCTLSGTTLTATRGGITCTVEATRSGDSNYLVTSDTQTITVTKITQTLSFQSTAPTNPSPGSTYTVRVTSSASLAATVTIANSSSAVCTIASGIITFNAVGTCLISASQSGDDTYSSAAASQSITVVTDTTTPTSPSSTSPTQSPTTPTSSPTPQQNIPTVTTTTTPSKSPTSSSTTTTTIPLVPTTTTTQAPAIDATMGTNVATGETFAIVQGKKVAASVSRINNSLVISLPDSVELTIGAREPGSSSAGVSSDGVLRVSHQQSIDIRATRLQPQSTYTVVMYSEPTELGRGTTSATGDIDTSIVIPRGVETTDHTLQITGADAKAKEFSLSIGFTVVEEDSNTTATVLVLIAAILLALLGGRPIFRARKKRRT